MSEDEEYVGTLAWFGVRWDAPMTDGAPEVPTPKGEVCLMCTEPILEGESGITMPSIESDEAGEWVSRRRPQHIECHLRSILGGVTHQERRCICFGGTEHDSDERSYRESARELMSWLIEHGK